ncbi:DUF4928 domain-containing protein [Saccharibacillus sp. O23]|uniref:DUF4928 family protein n=1 Tax=Saccharibacillus sp. O23 TaxID=2009338 RepID=UPI000B4E2636|nr:DUF4928 family protein [Saccharibacillus sp. O23]OWR33149.1 DUF4928 domain-containing protein [Saccharibacillus sp. O23]
MHDALDEKLVAYQIKHKLTSKGKLAAILYITRVAKEKGLPLDPSVLITDSRGQVQGLGKSAVQSILAEYNIVRILAEEGGRTSRGSLGSMQDYADFLNELNHHGIADMSYIEQWWIERIKDFFSSQPFNLRYDTSKSLRAIIRDLMEQAYKRQKENPGTMYAGAVLQHLVGAKLTLALPEAEIVSNGSAVADQVSGRDGDFHVGEVIIHVTTSPGEALMRKCKRNLESGYRPMIITTYASMPAAEALANIQEIGGRIDILEAEQFIATNVYEISKFKPDFRKVTIERLLVEYNKIIEKVESDLSLKISMG